MTCIEQHLDTHCTALAGALLALALCAAAPRCRRAGRGAARAVGRRRARQRAIADSPVPTDYANRRRRAAVDRRDVAAPRAEMSDEPYARRVPRDRPLRSDARGPRSAARARRDPVREQLPQVRDLDRRRARLHAGDAVLDEADRQRPTSNLFHLRTNLRYGCVILRHYLDIENGDLYRALGRYNGSLGRPEYPTRACWRR